MFEKRVVVPCINDKKDRDFPQQYFDEVKLFLISNYTVSEIAGAYINAMSGVTFEKLMKEAGLETCQHEWHGDSHELVCLKCGDPGYDR